MSAFRPSGFAADVEELPFDQFPDTAR